MVRSLESRQRSAEPRDARAQRGGAAVACPTGVPGVVRIPDRADIGGRGKERIDQSRIGCNNRSFVGAIDEQ